MRTTKFANGVQHSGGFHYNDNVTYRCNEGFNMTFGDTVQICQANGLWSGRTPNCSGKNNPFLICNLMNYSQDFPTL